MFKLITSIFGDPNQKEINKLLPLVTKINQIEADYSKTLLTDEDFPKKTAEFKERILKGETVDDLLPEAFALVKSACRRLVGRKWLVRGNETEWNMIPFDVQLIGGMVMHRGRIAEMKTGEGKTLVCTMPIYLNALAGRGVFLVTVNDYLAQRDAEWMGGLYQFLGLSIGVTLHGQTHVEKKAAYAADITYGTNNEFGFDYLRDNMATHPDHIVQRELFYAIVDEVDSILIDEARTPLIISSAAEESTDKYYKYSRLVPQLSNEVDYVIDEKQKAVTLTEGGIEKMEKLLGVENIYAESGFEEVHHLEQALKAHALFKIDVDYVVKDGEVIIVDEFTGRIMPGRRFSDGLHQALEAKEGVEVNRESKTLATVSFQNYFRLFKKLAGMAGTAITEAEEFSKIYKLDTIVIPPNRVVSRIDSTDAIYKTVNGKYMAAVAKVKELHAKGQPVLIGTVSIEKSEILSRLFTQEGIPHTVLNAKFHEKEAEIVAHAGQKGAVTIATNMAGRGTDIKLGEGVADIGGLFILGTERHESRRIDNQLRGRSGRQGDAGASQFLVSLDDELMRLFGGERIQKIMTLLNVPEDMPIENGMITSSIESAQKKVEARNFEIRKHLVEYDDVMNKQREIIYARRRKMLNSNDIKNDILVLFEQEAERLVLANTGASDKSEWSYANLAEVLRAIGRSDDKGLPLDSLTQFDLQEDLIDFVKHWMWDQYLLREKMLPDFVTETVSTDGASAPSGSPTMRSIERGVYLRALDFLWMEHIDHMARLREGVSFRGYGQHDPLIEYKKEGFDLFVKLLDNIRSNTVRMLLGMEVDQQAAQHMLAQAPEPDESELKTNADQIEGNLSGSKPEESNTPQTIKLAGRDSEGEKIGRNDPCHCGSGKKFKKCHGVE